ncbi:bifunctional folylpolyglutamate synthase/dihydrofolate synthase [Pediococcus claussenii]|uniref:tetrahydrofolate synthase n=1 Tax=Pediococcus claussenii (strain ATCC BAA-344 / DSM 14800 / JCM 18046 / KCTC 3811 / LMG 21948 / P06) TaxID=701521 RepID=G8PDL4_PEDCP|nr:cyanophycin synthetase [Pediococcus claussenii]AEV95349.1 bifunctional Dihydrofolate synthase/tetrahydrofolylpolyglutamate synthase protein FolC [Pediococcus claussenii ATCC BAA-344]ANZ68881.1 hypothetical protein AYR57_00460 [Pediococcus claussenii]ANZ70697.1 hypothetical protein AYR58_00460 [Pediococcus claussenii]KRN18992.1 folC protein [Pediococcus claussenii]
MENKENEYHTIIKSMPNVMSFGGEERIKWLKGILEDLGNPDLNYSIIHIAGTNGKGSTGEMTATVLEKNGYKVGHFASPAIWDDLEQISVNHINISQQAFTQEFNSIKKQIKREDSEKISIFEWFVLIALCFFAREKVDLVILEVGLGGTEDATNIIQQSLLTVITSISYDHTNILGKTIKKIAEAKAGIIRPDQTVILAPQKFKMVKTIVKKSTAEFNSNLVIVENDRMKINNFNFTHLEMSDRESKIAGSSISLKSGALYQKNNVATLLSILDYLNFKGWKINRDLSNKALASFSIPARYQVLQENPTVILDGAHNVDGISNLLKSVKKETAEKGKIRVVFGVLADKDYAKMSKIIAEYADDIFLIEADNQSRSLKANLLKQVFKNAHFLKSSDELDLVIEKSTPDDVIVVAGSFYVVKEFKKWIKDL